MKLDIRKLSIPLKHPFTITRGSQNEAVTALFRLHWRDLEGLGESAPSARYSESVDSILTYFAGHQPAGDDPYRLEELLHPGIPPAARCGFDFALHDLIGKDLGRPLWQLFGLDPSKTPLTSFTIGLDSIDVMLTKVQEARAHPVLKIKLGTGNEIEIISAIRSHYTGAIRIDANEGWNAEESVRILHELERYDIEYCEQPVPAGTPERLRYIRERSKIPIVADEDSRFASDLGNLIDCVDGVNVKLVKCGGLRAGLSMIHTARSLGFKVMIGCMLESAISSTAGAHLSPLVDWADLDGPLLVKDDPFVGIGYENGKIILPDGPGLGVVERANAKT
ncbi:MAG TPA: dipeptide epimerase [Candidatus Baltobacteraceae bacterium]|jgi:L-alanine-DL-glutamate epimerase-like enolase superfamily enzyme|nr:dipeptide epimerase [Candidatus Baltobacteraceae bacterium]